MANGEPKKKKKGKGCLIAFLIVGAIAAVVGGGSDDPADDTSTDTPEPVHEISAETEAESAETEADSEETEKETKKSETIPPDTTTPEQKRADYISSCKAADYRAIARDPADHEFELITFTGEVIQVSEGWFGSVILRIDTPDGVWYCTYTRSDDESRILEGDELTVYGQCEGVETYTTIFGASETIPSISIKYYELIDGTYSPASPSASVAPQQDPYEGMTAGQKNALRKAESYLEFMPFSWQGLIDQLVYEKFSQEDAMYAANNCGADWNEQALKKAASYLEFSGFSYTGLIGQLEFDKFSHELAVYAADNCGADWNEQAAKKAASYLDFMAFSRDGLIDQLEFDGFTHDQAVYGAEQNGY